MVLSGATTDLTSIEIYLIDNNNGIETINSILYPLLRNTSTLNIKLIGDSITAGFGGTGYTNDAEHGEHIYDNYYVNTNGYCWANLLKQYLESKYNCVVNNWGTSGINSSRMLENISSLIKDTDDIIICAVGTNDRAYEGDIDSLWNLPKSPETVEKNLQGILTYAKKLGKKIIFCSPIPASISNEEERIFHCEDLDNMFERFAYKNGIEYISMYKLFLDYCELKGITIDSLLGDGLHPNDNGYLAMFKLICDGLNIARKRPDATW